jgi:hypothetical protein
MTLAHFAPIFPDDGGPDLDARAVRQHSGFVPAPPVVLGLLGSLNGEIQPLS